jgi:hypothetical protein
MPETIKRGHIHVTAGPPAASNRISVARFALWRTQDHGPWRTQLQNTNSMQRHLSIVVRLAVCFILASGFLANAEDRKIDPTGTWKWSFALPGGETRESVLTLKLDGDKLSGTISGRRGDRPVTDPVLKGDEISFKVIREFDGNMMTNRFSGKISGDTIKGKTEFTPQGEKQTRDWEAKREAAKPAAPVK